MMVGRLVCDRLRAADSRGRGSYDLAFDAGTMRSSTSRRDFLPEVEWADDPTRILVCDDHTLLRRGLIVVLEEHPDLEVLGEAENGPEAAALAEQLAPDVVLVDVGLPPYGGVAAAAQISRAVPTARVIVLAANEKRPDELLEAVGAGAVAVVLKERSLDEGPDAVRRSREVNAFSYRASRSPSRACSARIPDETRARHRAARRHRPGAPRARGGGPRHRRGRRRNGPRGRPAPAVNLLRNLVRKLQRFWRAEDATVSLSTPGSPTRRPSPASPRRRSGSPPRWIRRRAGDTAEYGRVEPTWYTQVPHERVRQDPPGR